MDTRAEIAVLMLLGVFTYPGGVRAYLRALANLVDTLGPLEDQDGEGQA